MKFKVGDIVVLRAKSGYAAKPGATAKVVGLVPQGVKVIWDENHLRNQQIHGEYYSSSFDLWLSDKDIDTVSPTAYYHAITDVSLS